MNEIAQPAHKLGAAGTREYHYGYLLRVAKDGSVLISKDGEHVYFSCSISRARRYVDALVGVGSEAAR